ncbi:MAG: hypothetical protein ABUT20_54485, partial [Bacteroidota bacterium]
MPNPETHIYSSQNPNQFVPGWHILIDEAGKPHEQLKNLLATLSIEHDGTLATIVAETQKAWLRPKDRERWEIQECFENYSTVILETAQALGIIEDLKPRQKYYDYALLHGSDIHDVKERLGYLIKLAMDEISFNSLIILSGPRPLDPTIENHEILHQQHRDLKNKINWNAKSKHPETEIEMIEYIFNQVVLPEGLQVPTYFISSPICKSSDGHIKRPTTATTVETWLATNPSPGTCLAISNQPYVIYQDAVLKNLLPTSFFLETVGPALPHNKRNTLCGEILDTIARILYEALCFIKNASNRIKN